VPQPVERVAMSKPGRERPKPFAHGVGAHRVAAGLVNGEEVGGLSELAVPGPRSEAATSLVSAKGTVGFVVDAWGPGSLPA
jgi:hypothetical protein